MAQRFGKGVRLARVNHDDGKAMGAQGSSRHLLQAPGGLQQHDGNAVSHGLELAQERGHASLVVAKGLRFIVLTQGHLQRVFGDVNAYEKSFSRQFRNVCHHPSLQIRGLLRACARNSQPATVRARNKRIVIHAKCSLTGFIPKGVAGCG